MANAKTEDANKDKVWYWPGMRRNARSITTSPEIVKHIDGLTEANFKLLTKLIEWSAENETRQRKYRYAMVHRLTRIEAAISLLLVSQQVQIRAQKPFCYADQLEEDAKAAEEFIANQGKQMGLEMIRYIYREERAPETKHDRRRRWSGWEI